MNEATRPAGESAGKIEIDIQCPHCGAPQPPIDVHRAGRQLAYTCLSCGGLIVLTLSEAKQR
jgi:uncharacterized Zn finger protein